MNTRTITTHEPLKLKGGRASVCSVKPRKKEHKLFIKQRIDEFGDGFYFNIEEGEYYNNIIADGNRYFKTRNNGEFSNLYEDIKEYEDYYMGCYMEYIATYKGESCGFYYTDRWDVDDILKNIATCYNSNVEIVYDPYYN